MNYRYRDGREVIDYTNQDKLLHNVYSSKIGRALIKIAINPVFSRIAGSFLNSKFSCFMIDGFIKKNNIDLKDYAQNYFTSYNDCFTRLIKPEKRPIDMEASHLISPADGKVSVYKIDNNLTLHIKNTDYTVQSLLRSQKLANEYKNGYAIIIRLTVDNYHRYCYIDSGNKEENRFIQGVLHTVNPIANDYFKIYKENSREYTVIHTDNFGDVIQMEIGALMVGKIVNKDQKCEVHKGNEKGYFEFGGSTVVLFVKSEKVTIDQDLINNTIEDYETIVKMGEKIGCTK